MKLLLIRELRRLAPFGLGGAVLVLFLMGWVALDETPATAGLFWLASQILTPLVIGVALVAPDTASGGTAFLARLPISPGRAIAGKVLVGAAWALPAVGLGWTFGPALASSGTTEFMAPVAFGAGVVASVAAHRVATALLAAPIVFVVTVGGAVIVPLIALGVTGPVAPWTLGLLGLLLGAGTLATGGAAFRFGDRHRPSLRPAGIAASGLGVVLLATVSAAAAGQTFLLAAAVPDLAPQPGVARVGDRVLVPLATTTALGIDRRVASLDGVTGRLDWLLPVHHVSEILAEPNGARAVLTASGATGGALADLQQRTLRKASLLRWTRAFLWRPEGPLQVGVRGPKLWVHDPLTNLAAAVRRDPPAVLVGVDPAGGLILADATGLWRATHVERWTGRATASGEPLAPDARSDELAKLLSEEPLTAWPEPSDPTRGELSLSPSGRYVVWVGGPQRPEEREPDSAPFAVVIEVATGRRIEVPARHLDRLDRRGLTLLSDVAWRGYQATYSPDERWLAFERSGGEVALVDLGGGRVETFRPQIGSPQGVSIAWNPDGGWASLPSGLRLIPPTGGAPARLVPDPLVLEGHGVWAAGWIEGVGPIRSGPAGGLRVGQLRPLEGGAQ